jgi:hypothetical protein
MNWLLWAAAYLAVVGFAYGIFEVTHKDGIVLNAACVLWPLTAALIVAWAIFWGPYQLGRWANRKLQM